MFEQQGLSPFPADLTHQPGRRDLLDDADLLDDHSLLDAGDHGHLDNGHFATNKPVLPVTT